MAPEPGKDMLHYRILDKIGEGGMGEVWHARDTRLDRDVAIKVMSTETVGSDEHRARFRREALSLSKLNHPNIAIVYDFVAEGDLDLLVMEYVLGVGLDERLEPGPLPEKDVLRLGIELAEGLEAAHRQGIVHRDLKPANLRLTEDGRLKILDFGLAKLVRPAGADEATRTSTRPLQVAGTIPYMAPEQLRAQEVDARTDIFAAGALDRHPAAPPVVPGHRGARGPGTGRGDLRSGAPRHPRPLGACRGASRPVSPRRVPRP